LNINQREAQNSPAVITISSTILKLADEGEAITNDRSPAEISKIENSINPYNQTQSAQENAKFRQTSEPDYRYSLVNATSSVKSSYFKCTAETSSDELVNVPRISLSGEDEFICNEWFKNETFKKIKKKVDEAVKVYAYKLYLNFTSI
jgi:hypothetical protein